MALLAVILALVSAPITKLPDARVGQIEGTRAFIALTVSGDRLRVYVCDGTGTRRATVAQWFKGRWDGHSPLTLRAGGHVLRIDSAERGRFDGKRYRVRPAAEAAGLFRRKRQPLAGTWIALDERRVRGTMVDPRPKRCVPVMLSSGEYVVVCR
jgi:hypothetical protein